MSQYVVCCLCRAALAYISGKSQVLALQLLCDTFIASQYVYRDLLGSIMVYK